MLEQERAQSSIEAQEARIIAIAMGEGCLESRLLEIETIVLHEGFEFPRTAGRTLLHRLVAIPGVPSAIIDLLVDNGFEVNAPDGHGNTPLHFAVNTALAEALIRLGANPLAGGYRVVPAGWVAGERVEVAPTTPYAQAVARGADADLIAYLGEQEDLAPTAQLEAGGFAVPDAEMPDAEDADLIFVEQLRGGVNDVGLDTQFPPNAFPSRGAFFSGGSGSF